MALTAFVIAYSKNMSVKQCFMSDTDTRSSRRVRVSGLEILLTGAAIGLSVFTLMRVTVLEELVRNISKKENDSSNGRKCPPPSPPLTHTKENVEYETSEDDSESDNEDEGPPPPASQPDVSNGEENRIVELPTST